MKSPLQTCGTRHYSTQPCPRQACVVMAIRPAERTLRPPTTARGGPRREERQRPVLAPVLEQEIAETLIEQDANPALGEPIFEPPPYGTRCPTCWTVVRKKYQNAAARAKAFRTRSKAT